MNIGDSHTGEEPGAVGESVKESPIQSNEPEMSPNYPLTSEEQVTESKTEQAQPSCGSGSQEQCKYAPKKNVSSEVLKKEMTALTKQQQETIRKAEKLEKKLQSQVIQPNEATSSTKQEDTVEDAFEFFLKETRDGGL